MWRPPRGNELKLNVDGEMFMDSGRSGVGAIIRDNTGSVVRFITDMDQNPQISKPIQNSNIS